MPNEWIKCSERMPEQMVNVLFYDRWESKDWTMRAGYWNGRSWVPNADADGDSPGCEWISRQAVTHWMPLPEPPKEDSHA